MNELDDTTLAVLHQLERAGSLRRSDLAERADQVAKAKLGSAVEELVEVGLVERTKEAAQGRVGAPADVLRLTPDAGYPVVVDIGHETVRLAVGDPTGRRLLEAEKDEGKHPWDTREIEGLQRAVFNDVSEMLEQRLEKLRIDVEEVRGVGVAIAAPLDLDGRVARIPPGLSQANVRTETAAAIQLRLGVDVQVVAVNDANACALGEAVYGVGRALYSAEHGCKSFVFLKASAGIGVGIIRDLELQRGPGGIDGEFGHTPLPDADLIAHELDLIGGPPQGIGALREARNELICPWCGALGCLETIASATGMMRRIRKRGEFPPGMKPHEVINNAKSRDERHPICRWAIEETGTYLGVAVAGLVNTVDCDRVVIGGLLSRAGEMLVLPIQRQVDKRSIRRNPPRVCTSEVHGPPGLMGGIALVLRQVPVVANGASRRRMTVLA